jgi:lipopolysaccharide/colanic/teichoic acid biosynthesis glycosyltransferase
VLAAAFTGATIYDRFASRLALLPGALVASALTIVAAHVGNTSPLLIALCGVTTFSAVYVAKVFGVVALSVVKWAGGLNRRVAILADTASDLRKMATILSERDDIEIVRMDTELNLFALRLLASDGLLDEVILVGSNTDRDHLHALAGLAVTLVRADLRDTYAKSLTSGSHRPISPWNWPVSIVARPPLRGWYMVAKRTLDITVSLLAIVLLSPILVFCALMILIESGRPIFFLQQRTGYRGKTFNMIKFRSMYADQTDHIGATLTERDGDPRVTPFGTFLRRTSADELPQFFNILIGDMSVVGPRPHPEGAKAGGVSYDTLIPEFYTRYMMMPGLTGLAQVSGCRGNTETENQLFDRYRHDLQYAVGWSPLDDIVIIARTIPHLLNPKNAF